VITRESPGTLSNIAPRSLLDITETERDSVTTLKSSKQRNSKLNGQRQVIAEVARAGGCKAATLCCEGCNAAQELPNFFSLLDNAIKVTSNLANILNSDA